MRTHHTYMALAGSILALLITLTGCEKTELQAAPWPLPDLATADSARALPVMSDSGRVLLPRVMQRVLVRRDSLWLRALNLHYDAIVIDGHVDTPTLMLDRGHDIGERHRPHEAHIDLPRMYEGGLDAAFMSIYIRPGYGEGAAAMERAFALIDEVYRQVEQNSDSAALATSARQVAEITRGGRKAILLGLEGGHAIGGAESALDILYERGVRYVTVTHINSNSWADASQAPPRWDGLNDKGRSMIRRMNDLGMIVDLSHASDSTFFDVLKTTRAPVLLSHSSARALTPNVRNASDEMLQALADNGGVIMVNFFDAMVNQRLDEDVMREVDRRLPGPQRMNLWNVVYDVKRELQIPGAQLSDVVDHIDYLVRVAGVNHVGLGSDFDGLFDLPGGLEDVTRLPWITYELLARGYSDEDVRKILGGNVLRLMQEVENAAETALHEKADARSNASVEQGRLRQDSASADR